MAIKAIIAKTIITANNSINVIENAKLKSLENSAYGVVDAVRLYYMENLINSENGEVLLTGSVTNLPLSGEHPTGGTWTIENGKDVTDNRGIKIKDVTFASMQGYVCNSEENDGKLTGKVICSKQDETTINIVFEVADGTINNNGWAKANFNVKVTAEGATGLKYCLSNAECTPNQDVPSNGIDVTTEGINYICAVAEGVTVKCNAYNLDKTAPTLGTFDIVGTLGENGWYTSDVTIKGTGGSDDLSGPVITEVNISSITENTDGIVVILTTTNKAGLASTDTTIIKIDKQTPTLTAKESTPTVTVGESNLLSTYLNTPTYGASSGSVVCKTNGSEITNTSSLAVGSHTITCNAVSNSGINSSDVTLTITVEEEKLIRLAVDSDGDGVAELGDEVCIGNECFYVLTNDGTNIRMLSKYRIDVSDNTTRKDRLQNTGTLITVFSSSTIKGTNPNSYEGSIVEDLVGDYKATLEGLGATISESTLLSYDEVTAAPFNCQEYEEGSCSPAYSWLYKDGNTTTAIHWTRSAYSDDTNFVWIVDLGGNVYDSNISYNDHGVRPVIGIPTSALN